MYWSQTLKKAVIPLVALIVSISTEARAIDVCDLLGSLEADPLSVSAPVAFQDISSTELVEACSVAIEKKDVDLARFHLLRARGHLRSGSYEEAINDITKSHEMGYVAATFAQATLYHFGEAIPQDLTKAVSLYELAYNNGITWAARGLSLIYKDFSFSGYDPELSKEWLKRFKHP